MRTDRDVLRTKHVGSGRRELRLQVARPREEQNKTTQAKAKAVPAPFRPLLSPLAGLLSSYHPVQPKASPTHP